MSVPVIWGLPEKKKTAAPPKCFNIASRVQKSGVDQPLSCRVHPVAILKILDAYVRRPDHAKRTIGTLLGWISEGAVVDITDSFTVVHKDTEDNVLMDQDHHKQMLALKQKVSPREVVVGWFSTGDEISTVSPVIHKFYQSKDSLFTPTAALPDPVHVLVDTTLTQQSGFGIKAYVNVRTTIADSLLQFHEVPLRVQTSVAEKSGISQLMQARRATREAARSGSEPKELGSIDGFEGGLKELLGLFRRMQEYVKAVQNGKVPGGGDVSVGRGLTMALCAEPIIDLEALEMLCQVSLQDALMVLYLSNLTKTQISIAEKINSQYNLPADML
mmetsp:Transcript_19919/g.46349  ORF Transcript_19919/g.46349 Transcript_19919/m.46349 type:complete len:330 (+) Transcript_19919:73-1062(+)|eukprot:CAMPEP_0178445916 /NCGR_PEP_ID=MMETSP0689_2-20121128/40472_1 /TAXON_ID=160604 /ORGANISM="Amphidinium massartii, Strain CS-259" /LENGTH=329 /DNA_ID=CAMNT_0020070599 /DNA_START=23 /DNA_END=1012 /DNA_ORIENTATION=-